MSVEQSMSMNMVLMLNFKKPTEKELYEGRGYQGLGQAELGIREKQQANYHII